MRSQSFEKILRNVSAFKILFLLHKVRGDVQRVLMDRLRAYEAQIEWIDPFPGNLVTRFSELDEAGNYSLENGIVLFSNTALFITTWGSSLLANLLFMPQDSNLILVSHPAIYGRGRLYDRIAYNSQIGFFSLTAADSHEVSCEGKGSEAKCIYNISVDRLVEEFNVAENLHEEKYDS